MSDKSDGLLAKHMLLVMVIRTDWATKLDHKVVAEITERYVSRHGNARASLRYLEKATNATRTNIVASLRRLEGHGAVHLIREGKGTRPSEYRPNFDFSSGPAGDTTTSGIAHDTSNEISGLVGDTTSGIASNTTSADRGIAGNTESLLLVPVTTGDKVRELSAPGTGHGLSATPSRASVDRVVQILASDIDKDEDEGSEWLTLHLSNEDGTTEPFSICIQSDEQGVQERGAARLQKLLIAVGLDEIDDSSELHGIPFVLTANDDFKPMEAA